MTSFLCALIIFAAAGLGVWLASFVVEALRPKPKPPAKLRWAPEIPIQTVEVGGNTLRYIKSGKGPALVLLHTLRTQLDLFEKIVPELSKHSRFMPSIIRATAIRTFPRNATTPTSSSRRSKASSIHSIFATSRSPAFPSAVRSRFSSPPSVILAWLGSSPSTLTTTPRAAAWRAADWPPGL